MSGLRVALATLILVCSSACGGPTLEDRQKEVQSALDKGDYPAAIAAIDASLADAAISGDPARSWRFESMRLDALARGGKGDDVLNALDRLQPKYPTQITAALLRSLADKLRAASDTLGAIGVLDRGLKTFPAEAATFEKVIEEIKNAPMDSATEEMLRKLGYLN